MTRVSEASPSSLIRPSETYEQWGPSLEPVGAFDVTVGAEVCGSKPPRLIRVSRIERTGGEKKISRLVAFPFRDSQTCHFRQSGLAPGFYEVSATGKDENLVALAPGHIEARQTAALDLSASAVDVVGKVLIGDEPAPDFWVSLSAESGRSETKTEADGLFSMTMSPGSYALRVSPSRYLPIHQERRCPPEMTIQVRLKGGGSMFAFAAAMRPSRAPCVILGPAANEAAYRRRRRDRLRRPRSWDL